MSHPNPQLTLLWPHHDPKLTPLWLSFSASGLHLGLLLHRRKGENATWTTRYIKVYKGYNSEKDVSATTRTQCLLAECAAGPVESAMLKCQWHKHWSWTTKASWAESAITAMYLQVRYVEGTFCPTLHHERSPSHLEEKAKVNSLIYTGGLTPNRLPYKITGVWLDREK